mgnify:CR=1 FL=1
MNKIAELISRLCPDGVEFKTLDSLVSYVQPGPYIVSSTEYDAHYSTPVLTAGQSFIIGKSGFFGLFIAGTKEKKKHEKGDYHRIKKR